MTTSLNYCLAKNGNAKCRDIHQVAETVLTVGGARFRLLFLF